jgi:hypothetical protein
MSNVQEGSVEGLHPTVVAIRAADLLGHVVDGHQLGTESVVPAC